MYSKGCSAGVQQVTAAVVPQVCAPPAAHSVRTGAEPPVHHLCTRPVHPGLGPLVFPTGARGKWPCTARAVQQVCSWPLRWWFRMHAHRVRTTRCALGAHRCGTTCAPPVHQACASGAGTPCIPTVYKGPEHMCSQGCSQAAQKGHLFNVSTVGGPR